MSVHISENKLKINIWRTNLTIWNWLEYLYDLVLCKIENSTLLSNLDLDIWPWNFKMESLTHVNIVTNPYKFHYIRIWSKMIGERRVCMHCMYSICCVDDLTEGSSKVWNLHTYTTSNFQIHSLSNFYIQAT